MAGLLGKLEQFDPELEEGPQFMERLGHFFQANGITREGNKVKALIDLGSDRSSAVQEIEKFLISCEAD